MFQFLSSRRALFRFIGGAVAGLFASRVKAEIPVTEPARKTATKLSQPPLSYDARSGSVEIVAYDSPAFRAATDHNDARL